jgi:hypothetical protein
MRAPKHERMEHWVGANSQQALHPAPPLRPLPQNSSTHVCDKHETRKICVEAWAEVGLHGERQTMHTSHLFLAVLRQMDPRFRSQHPLFTTQFSVQVTTQQYGLNLSPTDFFQSRFSEPSPEECGLAFRQSLTAASMLATTPGMLLKLPLSEEHC